jgi:phenylacetate-coenzyme A ligase PaaK-like adenylate-forming protein
MIQAKFYTQNYKLIIKMHTIEDLDIYQPYSLDSTNKNKILGSILYDLEASHNEKCIDYNKIAKNWMFKYSEEKTIENLPFIPVRLFKELELLSIDRADIRKTLTSSGTSGQAPSKIFLDAVTSTNQTRVLNKILSSFIGKKRLPMLIIDSQSVIKNRISFSARGAGILGFSMFGYDVQYLLDDDFNLDIELLQNFLEKHKGEKILLFGFTYIVWEFFNNALQKKGISINLENGILIHGGGWKKMIDSAVDTHVFRKSLFDKTKLEQIYNYYGLVEQTGSIFMECESGYLHASNYSDIIIRNHKDYSVLPNGQEGLVQLVSALPKSYPGHSILTEDLGTIIGIDSCTCGRKGKYFTISGRIKNAEVRGCSDTIQK